MFLLILRDNSIVSRYLPKPEKSALSTMVKTKESKNSLDSKFPIRNHCKRYFHINISRQNKLFWLLTSYDSDKHYKKIIFGKIRSQKLILNSGVPNF